MERLFSLPLNQPLTIEAIQQILAKQISPTFSPGLIENLKSESHSKEKVITPTELQAFAIGLGSETPSELTPLMLVLLADFFSKYPIANSPQIVARIQEFYNFEVLPQVFSQGLYGSPTAHLLLPVFGAGKVYYQGYLLKAADVHDIFSWQPVPWPDNLPAALTEASFLGLSNLIYSFIQFKQIVSYFQILLPTTALLTNSENLFQDQIDHLETQINSYLASTNLQSKHVNGLVYQLVKLLTKFGEHIFENTTQELTNSASTFVLGNNIGIDFSHLLALLEVLSQENLIMFESNFDTNLGTSIDFTNLLMIQPYLFLKNLEKIVASTSLLQLTGPTNADNKLNEVANLRFTYRNQVVDVLQEANFDELIRKTIAFMYAHISSSR